MKKTLLTCLAVVALLAIASGARRHHVHHRSASGGDAARPVLPGDVQPGRRRPWDTGANALDTLVTIGNASSAPMIAHVNVFNERYGAGPRLQHRADRLRHPVVLGGAGAARLPAGDSDQPDRTCPRSRTPTRSRSTATSARATRPRRSTRPPVATCASRPPVPGQRLWTTRPQPWRIRPGRSPALPVPGPRLARYDQGHRHLLRRRGQRDHQPDSRVHHDRPRRTTAPSPTRTTPRTTPTTRSAWRTTSSATTSTPRAPASARMGFPAVAIEADPSLADATAGVAGRSPACPDGGPSTARVRPAGRSGGAALT